MPQRLALSLIVACALLLPVLVGGDGGGRGDGAHARLVAADRVGLSGRAASVRLPLPDAWCGVERDGDRPGTPDEQHVKVVYAYASDRPSRLPALASRIQADVAAILGYWAQQTGGRKTLRVDMGTECGPQFVDIERWRMPRPAAEYARGANVAQDYTDAHAPLYGPAGSTASCSYPAIGNVLVYADDVHEDGLFSGVGYAAASDSQPGPGNENNCGGGVALVEFGRRLEPVGRWLLPNTATHELLHVLGAWSPLAPHATPGNHCTDERDVFCYDDDGAGPTRTRVVCPEARGFGPITEGLDCGNDDYFAPPGAARGPYLPTGWNVYDSASLVDCAQARLACSAVDAHPAGIDEDGGDSELYRQAPARREETSWRTSDDRVDLTATARRVGRDRLHVRVRVARQQPGAVRVRVCVRRCIVLALGPERVRTAAVRVYWRRPYDRVIRVQATTLDAPVRVQRLRVVVPAR